MKSILFITLRSDFLDDSFVFPYLGVLYLVGVAEKLGAKFAYTDTFNLDQCAKYDIIAISCLTPQAKEAYDIRRACKDKIVVIGGPHTKGYADECIAEGFDTVIVGDGEEAIERILLDDCFPQIMFYRLDEEIMNQYMPLRERQYINKYKYWLKDRYVTTIVNSRGCSMGCGFCEDANTGARWYSPEHFEAEIDDIRSLGIKGVMIFDDLFAFSLKKVKPYLKILKEQDDFIFRCFGHAATMTKSFAKELAKAGCVSIGFGVESASQVILDRINKNTKVKQLYAFVENCVDAGIDVKAFCMIGLPGETKEDFDKTYKFIVECKEKYGDRFDFDLTVFFPYKGTEIGSRVRSGEDLGLYPRISWEDIDAGKYGAYKKKDGDSDIVTFTSGLSVFDIYGLKQKTLELRK